MKKKFLIVSVLTVATFCVWLLPVKESQAVKAYEFWGTPESITCYETIPVNVKVNGKIGLGSNGKPVSVEGGVELVNRIFEGCETVCNGFQGLCNGTNCILMSGQARE